MAEIKGITPCLWFDTQGEDAARFYTGIFPNSRIVTITRYPKAGQEIHGRPEGAVMTVEFELAGQPFTALNGGPHFTLSEAISFQVMCETQADIDYFWEELGAGGDPTAQQCGWLKDTFGLSWQIVPASMGALMTERGPAAAERVMGAMMQMKKIDLPALERAANG